MKLSQVLNELMTEANVSAYKISRETGISDRLIGYWRKGEKMPSAENLLTIANYFGISVDYLLTGEDKIKPIADDEIKLLKHYKRLPHDEKISLISRAEAIADIYEEQVEEFKPPILSIYCSQNRVSAGVGDELFDYEQWDTVDVIETPVSRKADFMLIVDGESMSPKFHDGDHVLVRQQPAVEPGQIGIFYIDGKGYIKKYDGDYLISLNPNYDDINIVGKEPRCFGLVLGIAELV